MPVSARSKGGPLAMSSAARFWLPCFKCATIAMRSIGSSSSLLRVHVPERFQGGEMYGLDVLAVHVQRVHPERLRAVRQVPDRLVLRLGCRFRPAVVLADEDGGDPPELGEVERLVEGADVRRSVAEEG